MTLLSGPVVGGGRPTTVIGGLALTVAVGGLFAAVVNALAILVSREPRTHGIDLRTVARELDRDSALHDSEAFYVAMIQRFSRSTARNAALLDSLHDRFTAIMCGILVMLCGLALAALVG